MTKGAVMDGDPFVEGLFGGSPRTATSAFATSIGVTTVRENLNAPETSSSDPETRLSSELAKGTRRSRGDIPAFGATGKRASNATSSVTKARTYRRSLSDRLTLSLISAGLGLRHYTFVNKEAVRSTNPGFCFRQAGWTRCGETALGLLIFEKL